MDLRLDGALGSIEGDGKLGIGQPVDVPEDDRRPVRGWQLRDQGRPAPVCLAPFNHGRRRSGWIGSRFGKGRAVRGLGIK